jgi:orotate phosphoribosyltransferase
MPSEFLHALNASNDASSTTSSPASPSPSALIAQALVKVGAVRIMSEQPFVYTSGWASPVYVDTRLLMSDVALRRKLIDIGATQIAELVTRSGINAIVGAESSGIAMAAWLADRLDLPLLYLRKRAMGWGTAARLEGRLPADARLLFIDDVTTDARSKIVGVSALRGTGAQVEDCLVILDYAIYPKTQARLAEHSLNLHSLTNWRSLCDALRASGTLSSDVMQNLAAFTEDPVRWSVENGGVGV